MADISFGSVREDGELSSSDIDIASLNAATIAREISDVEDAAGFLATLLDSSADCIKVLDRQGRILYVNNGGVRVLEASSPGQLIGRSWPQMWSGAELAHAAQALARSLDGEVARFRGPSRTLQGSQRHWDVMLAPIRLHGGSVDFVLATARDITDQQRMEVQRELLARELNHRVKNILTVVGAIAQQTLRPPATLADAAHDLNARILALAQAQSIFTASNLEGAEMGSVVEKALAPYNRPHDRRFLIRPGPELFISPSQSMHLALAIHELATNALKYGALTTDDGTVSVGWGPLAEGTQLQFEWLERGGPPVLPPSRRGFGSKLIERALAAEFRSKARLVFAPEGLEFRLCWSPASG
ncbi:sensor histidine kinase [Sandaracinobacteroides hominis]|uniref:sensor histidine kinase n=1 Tax=Sandaracinobacteroides hominis TaxID=2780086 RepID=UPI0018F4127D|nr:HWE histidine kinase domain-containing protein [Sandaracinobacteroides hominis]